jgi:hypothetical protein
VEQLVSAGAITEMRGNWMIESASGLKAIGRVPKEPAEDLRLELTQVEGVASLSPQQKRDEEKLAYVIKSQSVTTVSLRTEPRTLLDTYIRTMLLRYDFYDVRWNPQGSFDNQFVDNGDGTITDRSTGLMWQKSGSSRMKSREGARAYVSHLNGFAGHGNWRLPTIYELASLLEREKKYGVHIDPVFDYKQKRCWSSDRGYTVHVEEEWILDYDEGRVSQAIISDYDVYKRYDKNYVRAVRSIE